jgi:hypothetical protein
MTDAVPVMLNQVSTPAGVTEGWTAGGVRKCEVAAAVRFRGAEHAWVGRSGLYGTICQAGQGSPAGEPPADQLQLEEFGLAQYTTFCQLNTCGLRGSMTRRNHSAGVLVEPCTTTRVRFRTGCV